MQEYILVNKIYLKLQHLENLAKIFFFSLAMLPSFNHHPIFKST